MVLARAWKKNFQTPSSKKNSWKCPPPHIFCFEKHHTVEKFSPSSPYLFHPQHKFSLITSGKLWLKMRRISIIWHVLHICVSSLRLKHRMSLIQCALESPGLVDYFSYPHHVWKVRKKVFRAIWKQKFASKMRKVRNFEMVKSAWKRDFSTANFFFESF